MRPETADHDASRQAAPCGVDRDRPLTILAFALAALALGHALQLSNGFLHSEGLAWLTVALVLCILGVAFPSARWLEELGDRPTVVVLGLGLTWQFAELLTHAPGVYFRLDPKGYEPFFVGLGVAAVLAGGCLARRPWLGRAQFPLLLLVHFLLGVWLIQSSPNPDIDVHLVQQDAARALLSGENPYTITHRDIYGPGSPFYGEGVTSGGRTSFGYPYPPPLLFLSLPGYVLGGDYRYAQLAALTISGALLAFARPGPLGSAAAALLLFTPRVFFVLESGWNEPGVILFLAAALWCACRAPRLLPLALGLLLTSKQYAVLAIPLVVLLSPRPLSWAWARRLLVWGALPALAVSASLMLWDLPAAIHDVVVLQFLQPFRRDALSYPAWWLQAGASPPSIWPAFAAAALAAGLALWRCPRTPAGFAAALALVLFAFFALSKQAFCNYYFCVLGAVCGAVATANLRAPRRHTPETCAARDPRSFA